MPQMTMIHMVDPAKEIREAIGDLSQFEIFGNYVLIGVYKRPEQTQGKIFIPETTRHEDTLQGKAGLVLAMGPNAFVSDENYDFGSQKIKVGDWVAIFVSDGRKIQINKQLCRLVEDQHIRLRIPAPDAVW